MELCCIMMFYKKTIKRKGEEDIFSLLSTRKESSLILTTLYLYNHSEWNNHVYFNIPITSSAFFSLKTITSGNSRLWLRYLQNENPFSIQKMLLSRENIQRFFNKVGKFPHLWILLCSPLYNSQCNIELLLWWHKTLIPWKVFE